MICPSFPRDNLITNHVSVRKASEHFRYSPQYLRRMLREGRIEGQRVGSMWLINANSLEAYVDLGNCAEDRRFGPRLAE